MGQCGAGTVLRSSARRWRGGISAISVDSEAVCRSTRGVSFRSWWLVQQRDSGFERGDRNLSLQLWRWLLGVSRIPPRLEQPALLRHQQSCLALHASGHGGSGPCLVVWRQTGTLVNSLRQISPEPLLDCSIIARQQSSGEILMLGKTFAGGALCATFILAIPFAGSQQAAVLTIHADQPVPPVSPTLYGLMTEEINYSYDGGLYAEMVRNRTFRSDWSGVAYWYLVEKGNAAAKMEPDKTDRPQRCPEVEPAPRCEAGRRAESGRRLESSAGGAWPCGPTRPTKARFTPRPVRPILAPVTVSLVNDDTGKAVDNRRRFRALSTDWKQYEFTLKTGGDRALVKESSRSHRRPPGNALAQPRLAVPAHLSQIASTAIAST